MYYTLYTNCLYKVRKLVNKVKKEDIEFINNAVVAYIEQEDYKSGEKDGALRHTQYVMVCTSNNVPVASKDEKQRCLTRFVLDKMKERDCKLLCF